MRVAIIGFLCVAFSTSAFAVDLTIDQTAKIFKPDGKTAQKQCEVYGEDGKCQAFAERTVGSTIQEVLTAQLPDQSGRGQDPENGKAGALAIRLYAKDNPVLKADDLTMILRRVDKVEDPVTQARMHELLEPSKDDPPK